MAQVEAIGKQLVQATKKADAESFKTIPYDERDSKAVEMQKFKQREKLVHQLAAKYQTPTLKKYKLTAAEALVIEGAARHQRGR